MPFKTVKSTTGSNQRAGLEEFSSNFSSEYSASICVFSRTPSFFQELSSQRERDTHTGFAWIVAPRSSYKFEEEQSRSRASGGSRSGLRLGKRRVKRRSGSHQHLMLMYCVGGSGNDDASEETVPLPDYERLSPSARLPGDPDPKDPSPPLTPVQQQQRQTTAKREASPQPTQQQKPAAWRLIEYVRSRHRAGGGGAAGVGSDGDSKSSDGEKEGEDGGEEGKKDKKKKKKRSSWLPDPDRRWPVQGFY